MTYDADLNLIVCEHATSMLVRERPDGRREVLASHFGGKELNSSQRCLCALGRLDLFHRSHLWPLAALRRRTAARARLSGRLSRVPGRRSAAAARRRRSLRSAERPLLLPRREAALRQRLGAEADPRVRRRAPTARSRTGACSPTDPLVAGAGRSRRHEMRRARQRLGHRARAAYGSMRPRATLSERCARRSRSPISPGAGPISTPCSSPRASRSTGSRPRSGRAANPT